MKKVECDLKSFPKTEYLYEIKNFKCWLRRTENNNWNAYVILTPSHPLFFKHYVEVNSHVDVHGGLTFGPCPSEGDLFSYLGFDTSHEELGDVVPVGSFSASQRIQSSSQARNLSSPRLSPRLCVQEHYWTHEETLGELVYLVDQLQKIQEEENVDEDETVLEETLDDGSGREEDEEEDEDEEAEKNTEDEFELENEE